VRYPRPLRPGDRIAVTAPSAGVPDVFRPRLDHAVHLLREAGYGVVLGECLDGSGIVSAPARERAAELTALLCDPTVAAVVPPWGGELAIDLLPLLDLDALRRAEPTWFVGYSDISVLLTPLTLATGVATLHGQNLMATPFALPGTVLPWLDVVRAAPGEALVQRPSARHRGGGLPDIVGDPGTTDLGLDTPGTWRLLGERAAHDAHQPDVHARGRLVGGCLEVISHLPGTPFGNLAPLVAEGDGLVVYLETAEVPAADATRRLRALRMAGWFDHADAVLIGRTASPGSGAWTHDDGVRDALGDLDVPVVLDVDCGHVPPGLSLVNGALATLDRTDGAWTLRQELA
jgi:muramoyltetrapeptide carboxypeptidase LdcA involved in peptidoglycan recycling